MPLFSQNPVNTFHIGITLGIDVWTLMMVKQNTKIAFSPPFTNWSSMHLLMINELRSRLDICKYTI
jgi:hypothetical protein